MHFLSSIALLALLTTTATANPSEPRNNDDGLPKICKDLKTKTKDNGCIRCPSSPFVAPPYFFLSNSLSLTYICVTGEQTSLASISQV